jgi:hypothetical protein
LSLIEKVKYSTPPCTFLLCMVESCFTLSKTICSSCTDCNWVTSPSVLLVITHCIKP